MTINRQNLSSIDLSDLALVAGGAGTGAAIGGAVGQAVGTVGGGLYGCAEGATVGALAMASRPGEGSLAQRIGTKAVDIAQGMAGGCILGGAYRGSTAGDAGRAIGASAGNKLTAGY